MSSFVQLISYKLDKKSEKTESVYFVQHSYALFAMRNEVEDCLTRSL